MSVPRVRFTVQRITLGVAIVGVIAGLAVLLLERRSRFLEREKSNSDRSFRSLRSTEG